MKIKCLAIDDEPLALQQIGAYIEKTPFLEKMALCESAFDAMNYLENNEVDLMFVDINMPDLNGMDFVKSLSKKPQVIFTTAYSDYAMQAFEVDALGYVLKPISYPLFLKAATKAQSWLTLNSKPIDIQSDDKNHQDTIFVKAEGKIIKIYLADIEYIESANEYIVIHLQNEKKITTFIRLKVIEEQLPKDKFMRVHRSFIVNLSFVKVIERNRIIFNQKTYIPISDQYKDKFQDFIDNTLL